MQLLPNQSILFWSGGWVKNPMKNELKTRPCLKLFQLPLEHGWCSPWKARGDKQLYLITHFTKQTLNLNYFLLTLNVNGAVIKLPKTEKAILFSKLKFSLNGGDLVF